MKPMHLALLISLVAIFTAIAYRAWGGERVECEIQPVTGDGREWHYRTKVGGRPEQCWYPGERMKPRSELYWAEPSKEKSEEIVPMVIRPAAPPNEFDQRWRGQ
jgi:hypothetical protein